MDLSVNADICGNGLGHESIQIQPPLAKINIESIDTDDGVEVINVKSDSKIAETVVIKSEDDEIFGDLEELKFEHKMPTPSIFDYDFESHWNIKNLFESEYVSRELDDGGSRLYYYL